MLFIEDLELGRRVRISEKEFAYLRGCSQSTLQKQRHHGTGADFLKDPATGRVSYSAEAVLAFLNRPLVCKSTTEYDTRILQDRLEKARTVQMQRSGKGQKSP